MSQGKHAKKQPTIGSALYWMAGILLVLTMLITCLVSRTFARYTASEEAADAAHVAAGLPRLELWEHEAELKDGEYVLNSTEVTSNKYEKVIPGVDIAKDPFVRLTGDSEVSYEVYVKVIEQDIPADTVKYEIRDDWKPVSGQDGVYQYTGTITSGTPIYILKDNQLTVSEHYVGSNTFSLAFSAWIEQVD